MHHDDESHPRTRPGHRPPRPRRPNGPLLLRFDREWRALRTHSWALDRARRWAVTDEPFEDLDDLLRAAGFCAPSTPATDAVLAGLLVAARTDDLAARVVLQRILPGLAAAVRGRPAPSGGDPTEEIVGAAWIVIRDFPVERRGAHVAANLVRDAGYRAFVKPRRRMSAHEVAVDPAVLDDIAGERLPSACDELAELLAEAVAAGLPAADAELLRELLDLGSATVAAGGAVTARTIRYRRDRVVRQIRRLALVA